MTFPLNVTVLSFWLPSTVSDVMSMGAWLFVENQNAGVPFDGLSTVLASPFFD
jgi:hypothetical protein